LDKKLKVEDVNIKKFIIGKFLDFKMVDLRTGMSQVQEFQLILHDIHVEGMSLSAYSQMAAIIEKLSPSRKDFKKYFKHKQKEMRVKNLILKLRIEDDNTLTKIRSNSSSNPKTNIVEQVTKFHNKNKKRRLMSREKNCQEVK
jgi:hypothetical protein